jgi:hypothetical protein
MWAELFFDLVFVVAVGRTTDLLHEDPSPIGTLWFGFIFVVLVWTWSNFVLYTERFETDDVVHRLSKGVAMFAVAAGALLVPTVRKGDANEFVVAYVAVRLVWWLTFDFVEAGVPSGRAHWRISTRTCRCTAPSPRSASASTSGARTATTRSRRRRGGSSPAPPRCISWVRSSCERRRNRTGHSFSCTWSPSASRCSSPRSARHGRRGRRHDAGRHPRRRARLQAGRARETRCRSP